jgi:hypothetical protein
MWVSFAHLRPSGHIMPDHAGDRGAVFLALAPHDHLHIKQIRTVQRSPGVPRPGLRLCVLPSGSSARPDRRLAIRPKLGSGRMGSARPGWPRRSSRRAGSRQRARPAVPPRRAGRAWRELLRLGRPGGGASSDTGAVSAGWLVRTDQRAIGPKLTRSPLRALMSLPPVDPGTSGTGGAAPPPPETFVWRLACSGTWPASKP